MVNIDLLRVTLGKHEDSRDSRTLIQGPPGLPDRLRGCHYKLYLHNPSVFKHNVLIKQYMVHHQSGEKPSHLLFHIWHGPSKPSYSAAKVRESAHHCWHHAIGPNLSWTCPLVFWMALCRITHLRFPLQEVHTHKQIIQA